MAASLPGVEIESPLTARLDQPVALPEQDLLALHDHRQLGHGPGDVGEVAGQRFELPFDRPRRDARRQQFRQPPGRGDFLEIEIRQPPHLADRHDQSPPVPAANHRHRDAQQVGQHGRRIEPVDLVLRLDQPEPLPELRLRDDLDRPLLDLPSRGLVEPLALILDLGQGELLLADDDQVGRSIRFLQHRRAVLAGQLRSIALGHAGQPADKRDALILEYHGDYQCGQPRASCQCGRALAVERNTLPERRSPVCANPRASCHCSRQMAAHGTTAADSSAHDSSGVARQRNRTMMHSGHKCKSNLPAEVAKCQWRSQGVVT